MNHWSDITSCEGVTASWNLKAFILNKNQKKSPNRKRKFLNRKRKFLSENRKKKIQRKKIQKKTSSEWITEVMSQAAKEPQQDGI